MKDFVVRKAKAWNALNIMNKIWKSGMSRRTKIRLFRATVETILPLRKRGLDCYKEPWEKAGRGRELLQNAPGDTEHPPLRQGVKHRPEVFRDLPRISEKIRTQRLKLAGHLEQHEELLGHQLVGWKPKLGKSRPGRHAITFPDTILQDLEGVCDYEGGKDADVGPGLVAGCRAFSTSTAAISQVK